MRRLTKLVLACGTAAAVVGITPASAGPFSVFRGQSASETAQAPESNTALAQKVAGALKGANLSGKNIQIEVQNGVAVLKGQIADSRQKAAATAAVAGVSGVRSVDNQMIPMKATPAAPSAIQQAGFTGQQTGQIQQVGHKTAGKVSNQQVAQAVANGLSKAGLAKYDIEVRFKKGIVSLIGDVGNPMEALKAQEVAYANGHVNQVVNKLTAGGLTADELLSQMQQGQGGVQPAGYMPPMPQGQAPQYGPRGPIQPAGAMGMGAPMGAPAPAAGGSQVMYNGPNLPNHAWPSYAPYDNYAAVTYPSQYDASAFPYIGPFYPYPQVPMGWRDARLQWDDGSWNLSFNSRTDRWWWFLNPHNWE